mmetsp:Transcript_34327/g.103531  ORF Transcript_34327/g.103531 Transcript_34327/m.103531 type:complete len:520 (+) Transcript_34327:219-1778(+)
MADPAGADAPAPAPDGATIDAVAAAADEVLQSIRRDINCLSDSSKMARKRAINTIRSNTLDASLEVGTLQLVLDAVLKPLLKLFTDKVEKIRELALELLIDFVKAVDTVAPSLPYLIPAVESRMGQNDLEESSEEVRLLHVQLVAATIAKADNTIEAFHDDLVRILVQTVTDQYPDVIKQSCECVKALARAAPVRFYGGSKPLSKPLLKAVGHQHSRVRVQALQAIEAFIIAGDKEALMEFMVPLAGKSMDHAPTVRRALYTAVGHWMLDLPDRYSYWSRLLSLMLNGICDEVPEIQALCRDKFHAAGKQWEEENHDELKDMLDFGHKDPDRPPLGCRILVDREVGKILPGLIKDLVDWTSTIRQQAANLLLVLLMYAESQVTIHIEKVLTALFKSVRDEEPAIGRVSVQCTEVLGKNVEPGTWADIVLARLSTPGLAVADQTGMLIVLGGLLRGSGKEKVGPTLEATAKVLASDVVSGVQNEEMVDEIFLLVKDILSASDPGMPDAVAYVKLWHASLT